MHKKTSEKQRFLIKNTKEFPDARRRKKYKCCEAYHPCAAGIGMIGFAFNAFAV